MSRNGICMEPMKGLNITPKKVHLFSLGVVVSEEGHEDDFLNLLFLCSHPVL